MSTAPPLPPAPPSSIPPGSTPPGSPEPLSGDRQTGSEAKGQPAAEVPESAAKPQEKLSPALSGLLPGAILRGTVSGTVSGGSGALVVETAATAHRLVGEVKVAPGDVVELHIVSLEAGVQAELLSVNGEPRSTPVMLESVAAAPRQTTAPPRPGTTLGGNVIATPAGAENGPQSGPLGGPRLGLTAGSAIEVRLVAVELPPGERAEIPEVQIQGTVVEAAANSATLETDSGRLELAVSGAEAGTRLAVAATEAPPPSAPLPLARDAIIAAKPESGPTMAVRVISVEAPQIPGTVIEAAASPAPAPVTRDAMVAPEPESAPATAAPIVTVEAPVPEIRGTVVEVGEKRTVIETPSGRLSLALSAPVPLGTRVVAETVPEAPPAAAAPLLPQTLVAARAETEIKVGQSSFAAGADLALRINTIEPPAPRLLGTVVDSAAHRAVIETPAGRLTLALTGAALGTRIEAEVVALPPDPANLAAPAAAASVPAASVPVASVPAVSVPAVSVPAVSGSVVAARAETVLTLGRTIVAPQESLTLRIVSISGRTSEPLRLAGQVVASAEGRTRIETPIGELDLAAQAKVGQGLQLDVISRDAGVHRAVPPGAPEPLAPGRQVAAEIVGSGQPLVLRVVSVEAPQLQGTIVEASENRAVIETASGRFELAVSDAEPGARITVATTDARRLQGRCRWPVKPSSRPSPRPGPRWSCVSSRSRRRSYREPSSKPRNAAP